MLDFKRTTIEKYGSSKNKNVTMDVWPLRGEREIK